MKFFNFYFFLFLYFIPIGLLASNIPNPKFNRITIAQGLSTNTTYDIVQDQKGFLWIASTNGLSRYDGVDFKIFKHDPNDPESISSNSIRSLYTDSRGNIWIGTHIGGLNKYNYNQSGFTHYKHDPNDEHSISNNEILSIYEDSHGILWIGTENGLNAFDFETETFQRFLPETNNPNSISSKAILSIFEDHEKNLWIGTWDGGLNLMIRPNKTLDGISFKSYRHNTSDNTSISSNHVWDIFQDDKNRIWLATFGGLNLLVPPKGEKLNKNQQAPTFHKYLSDNIDNNTIIHNMVFSIQQDRKGLMWIGTANGLSVFDPTHLTSVQALQNSKTSPTIDFNNFSYNPHNFHTLSHNEVRNIFEDKTGILWFNTMGGISKYDPNSERFRSYLHTADAKSSISINTILKDNKAFHWIGTNGNGLLKYDPKKDSYTSFKHTKNDSNSLPDNYIFCLYSFDEEHIWIGTHQGLSIINTNTNAIKNIKLHPPDNTQNSGQILKKVHKDKKGNYWLATNGGLVLFDPITNRQKYFIHDKNNPSSISDHSITDITEDKEGKLWIGTMNGLNLLNYQPDQEIKFQHIRHDEFDPNSISSNRICNFQMTPDSLWIATSNGLSIYNFKDKKFTTISTNDGLPDNFITGITLGNSSGLWGSSRQGLFELNTQTHQFTHYDIHADFNSNYFIQNGQYKSEDGQIFFCGQNGYTAFYEDSIPRNNIIPSVYITGFKKFNEDVKFDKSIDELKNISLSYNDNFFTLEFASLNYTHAHKNKYAYKLEGVDKDWVYCGSQKFASYTNIDGGEYTFRVKASNNEGIWNEEGTSLTIKINPPIWKTWKFTFLLIFFIYSIIYSFFNWRTKSIRAKSEALEEYNINLNKEIHEKEKAEKALREREQLLQLTMDNIPQFIFWKDLNSVYLGCNKNFANAVGKASPEEIIGGTDYDLTDKPEIAKNYINIDKSVMTSGRPEYNIEEAQELANGQLTWSNTNKIPLRNDNGKIIGILGTFEDITQRKASEKALKDYQHKLEEMVEKRTEKIEKQKQKIEELLVALKQKNQSLEEKVKERTLKLQNSNEELIRSNYDLEQFAYIASHDLQEPLRMVSNFVRLLERRYSNQIDENGRNYINFAVEGVTRMSQLIENLLKYSRVGRDDVSFEKANLNHIVYNKIHDLSQRIQERNAVIELSCLPQNISCEANQIGMVFYNLIWNGLKFNQHEQPRIVIENKEEEEEWIFSVKDNGIGIQEEYSEKVFEIFKRLHARDEFEGTGIGLPLCKRIVNRHNGNIWFSSEYGKGSTFYFSIKKQLN